MPVQFPPVLTTISLITPQEPYPAPHTGLTVSRSDILCDRVLATPDVFLHRQETRRFPYRLRRGVFPCTARCSMRELSRQPSRHLGLNPPQGPSRAGSEHPGLPYENHYCLFHGLKKESGHPKCRSLLAEDMQDLTPQRLFPVQ